MLRWPSPCWAASTAEANSRSRRCSGSVIPVNDAAWRILTLRYGLYFARCGHRQRTGPVRGPGRLGRRPYGPHDVDPADVWVSFRGVLWIASSVFGLSQVPLIMKNLVADTPVDPSAPARADTAP